MFRWHISDDELLTLEHATESPLAKLRAHAHLKACRQCRARQGALESLARNWLDRRDRELSSFPVDAEEARRRFLLRVSESKHSSSPVRPLRLTLITAAMCAAVAAGVGVWTKVRTPAVVPLPIVPAHTATKAPAAPVPKNIESPRHPARKLPRRIAAPASKPPVLETEIAILWILHREGICARGSVEVSRASSGGLLVRGVLESPEERNNLESQLHEAAAGAPLELDLQVAGEAIPTPAAPAVSQPATTVVASKHLLPGEELVRAYLVTQGTPASRLETEVNRITNQSMRISGDLWAQSWALRRLEEQFSSEDLAALPPFSRGQLNRMAADHLAILTGKLEEIRSVLGGAIGIAGAGDSSAGLQEVSKLAASVEDCFAGSADRGMSVSECRSKLRDLLAASSAAIQHCRARAELAVVP